ncbi:hypothetical protein RR48_05252 [Papilio machaon]|uniref:Reverse transcriptase domain-containing protein n=1 Tax=Papilio machaon TaxID=76193 RepID=A0A0N1IHK8_PAPMA|nr:hypothetical protein RR48_05252 [Papilio machaon]
MFILFINDIHLCFHYCDFLLYADDLKVFHTINNIDNHYQIQQDLDRLCSYCLQNKLELNVVKCKAITFTKKRHVSKFNYNLNGITLENVNHIRDLGVTLDSKLHLDLHIDNIINKSFKMYGFIMRASSEFKRPSTYLYLYKTLVRSQLEYAVPIWNPYYNKYIEENTSRSRNISFEQLKSLIDFMGQHIEFATGNCRTLEARHASKRLWDELTKTLNNSRTGTKKTSDGWSKVCLIIICYIAYKAIGTLVRR